MNNFYEANNGEYHISTDNLLLDIPCIHRYLSEESYWAEGIPFETVKKAVDNSLCFGIYHGKEQVGFGRLMTDKATFAYLADVFVLPAHRGKGLSKWLMTVIHAHPELQGLRRWVLGTKDAHGLYKQFGWAPLTEDQISRFMQIQVADIYTKKQ